MNRTSRAANDECWPSPLDRPFAVAGLIPVWNAGQRIGGAPAKSPISSAGLLKRQSLVSWADLAGIA